MGRLWKRLTDTLKESLMKRGLDVRQERRMAQNRSEGECMGHSLGDEPLTLMRCHICELPQLYEAFEGWKSIFG